MVRQVKAGFNAAMAELRVAMRRGVAGWPAFREARAWRWAAAFFFLPRRCCWLVNRAGNGKVGSCPCWRNGLGFKGEQLLAEDILAWSSSDTLV